jgi:hypothetical protein
MILTKLSNFAMLQTFLDWQKILNNLGMAFFSWFEAFFILNRLLCKKIVEVVLLKGERKFS